MNCFSINSSTKWTFYASFTVHGVRIRIWTLFVRKPCFKILATVDCKNWIFLLWCHNMFICLTSIVLILSAVSLLLTLWLCEHLQMVMVLHVLYWSQSNWTNLIPVVLILFFFCWSYNISYGNSAYSMGCNLRPGRRSGSYDSWQTPVVGISRQRWLWPDFYILVVLLWEWELIFICNLW